MQKKLILLVVLAVLFILFIAARFFIVGQSDVYGRIKISSSPEANVFINNVEVGKTPYDNSRQKAGEYIVKLIPDKTATDTASWEGKVPVYKNALSYVNRELGVSDLTSAGEIFTVTRMQSPPPNSTSGEIYVDSEPQGAIVNLDNDEKGVAPLLLTGVEKGDHEITVSMPGFVKRTQKINIDQGYRVNASFKLAIDETQQPVPTPSAETTATPSASTVTPGASSGKTTIIIKDTPTGFLRVREEPSVNASESAQVKPGQSFEVIDQQNGWYKIPYATGKTGWVSAEYTTKK